MITSTVAILFAVGYLLATVWLCRGIRLTARDLCLGGIVCAMTLVLATIRIPLPTGSNITCGSWIPLMLLALLYDYRLSMLERLGVRYSGNAPDPRLAGGPLGADLCAAVGLLLLLGLCRCVRQRQALEGHLRHGAGGGDPLLRSCDQRCDLLFPERMGRLGRLGLQSGL